jgi:hypothetical protein
MNANITLDSECPQAARLPKFFVTALEDIKPPYVVAGDHLMIDPDAMPTDGKLVMIGERIEPWSNQIGIAGVAVYISREM